MSNFNSQLQFDAANCGSGLNDFGESVSVKKFATGAVTTFTANVFRETPKPIPGTSGAGQQAKPAPTVKVFIPCDPLGVNGLAVPPDRGGIDQCFLAEVAGGNPIWLPIVAIEQSDPGGWLVQVK